MYCMEQMPWLDKESESLSAFVISTVMLDVTGGMVELNMG